MESYKIEKSIPVPEVSGAGRPAKYPFSSMSVGDSIFIAGKRPSEISAHHVWGRRNNIKFMGRAEKDGMRVWRVK